jgi:hypothetical protein
VTKKSEQIPHSTGNEDVYRSNAKMINILKNPITLHPQQYELINLAEIDKNMQLLKEKIMEGQKLSENEQRDLVGSCRLKINHYSLTKNQIAIHNTIRDCHTWKNAIKLGYYFDIFKVSQEDIAEMKMVFEKITVPRKTNNVSIPHRNNENVPVKISEQRPAGIKRLMASIGHIFQGESATPESFLGAAINMDMYSKHGMAYFKQENITRKNIEEILEKQGAGK